MRLSATTVHHYSYLSATVSSQSRVVVTIMSLEGWKSARLQTPDLESPEVQKSRGVLEIGSSSVVEPWNSGDLDLWKSECFRSLNSGNLKFWGAEILESLNLELTEMGNLMEGSVCISVYKHISTKAYMYMCTYGHIYICIYKYI